LTGEVPASAGGGGASALAARTAQATKIITAKSAALPYWQELISRYSKSPRCEQAFYKAGVLLCEIAEAADAPGLRSSKSEAGWKDAAFMLGRFTEFYPKSPFAGDAYVRETDIALERMFDLALARTTAEQGVNWAKGASEKARGKDVESLPPWATGLAQSEPPSLKEVLYDCYLRAGLIAYLEQKYDQAIGMFNAANDVGCPRPYRVVQGTLPTGMERLIAAAQKATPLTPPEVLKGDSKAALVLGLGDLYFAAEQWDKARELYHLVYDQQVPSALPPQISWAAFMIARTHFWESDFAKAKQFYHIVFEKYPQSPWAATALYFNAIMAYSNLHDENETTICLDKLRRDYPKDEMAERATYLIGQLYQWRRDFDNAKAAYDRYLVTLHPSATYTQNKM